MIDLKKKSKPVLAVKVHTIPVLSGGTKPSASSKDSTKDDSHYTPDKKSETLVRRSQSKQEFRPPVINSSKLPQGFFSSKKPPLNSPGFSNSPRGKHSPLLEPICKNPIAPLKKFLDFSRSREHDFNPETVSHFKKRFQDFLCRKLDGLQAIEFSELVVIRELQRKKRAERSKKTLVFHASSFKLLVLEEYSISADAEKLRVAEENREFSGVMPGIIKIHKTHYNAAEGKYLVLSDYMSGGSLNNVLEFAGGLNERSIQSIFAQLTQILDHFPREKVRDFDVFFNRKGILKLKIGIFSEKANTSLEEMLVSLFIKCVFGDLIPSARRKASESCCLIHEIAGESEICRRILGRFSEEMGRFACCKAGRTKAMNKSHEFFGVGEFRDADVEMNNLLRLSNNFQKVRPSDRSQEDRLHKITQSFCSVIQGKTPDLAEIMEKITEKNRVVKEISETLGLQRGLVASRLRLSLAENKSK